MQTIRKVLGAEMRTHHLQAGIGIANRGNGVSKSVVEDMAGAQVCTYFGPVRALCTSVCITPGRVMAKEISRDLRYCAPNLDSCRWRCSEVWGRETVTLKHLGSPGQHDLAESGIPVRNRLPSPGKRW